MTQQNQLLADNFPAKTFLLITHLSETDPTIASFSRDGDSPGTSFEIYDQTKFAQQYLPQYFKHANYGSFVRQLNLYGFASSRLKYNSDVIVWAHENFQQDRQDLLKGIKRMKKTKSKSTTKPSHVVHVNTSSPRSPSPQSLSDDVSSETTNTTSKMIRSSSRIDHEWLESKFANLEQQNKSLELKVDALLQALHVSPVTLEEVPPPVGEKRRRLSPVESKRYAEYEMKMEPIYEEQKQYEGGGYGNQQQAQYYSGDNSKAPYDGTEASSQYLTPGDDSFKTFVDMMLNDDEEDDKQQGGESKATDQTEEPQGNVCSPEPSPEEPTTEGTTDNELMDRVMGSILPAEAMNNNVELLEDPQLTFNIESTDDIQPAGLQTRVQYVATKQDPEPELVRAVSPVSPEVPTLEVGDIEEGLLAEGVTVIEAHAELVEEDNNQSSHQQVMHHDRMHYMRDRKRLMCILSFIACAIVAGSTTIALVLSKRDDDEADITVNVKGLPKCPPGTREDRKWGGCKYIVAGDGSIRPPCPEEDFHEDGEGRGCKYGKKHGYGGDHGGSDTSQDWRIEEQDDNIFTISDTTDLDEQDVSPDSPQNATQVFRSYSNVRHHTRSRPISDILDDIHDGSPTFAISIAGTDFFCSQDDVLN